MIMIHIELLINKENNIIYNNSYDYHPIDDLLLIKRILSWYVIDISLKQVQHNYNIQLMNVSSSILHKLSYSIVYSFNYSCTVKISTYDNGKNKVCFSKQSSKSFNTVSN